MSPGSLVVSGIPISIFCAFSIPSVVDTSVMVKTFWIRLNQTLNNGDRIKISTSQSMAAYNTTLQITPVNISDTGMYQCVGSISSNSSYVVGSSNASANISLSVQGENTYETIPLCESFPLISSSPSFCGHHIIIWQHNSWISVLTGVYGEGGRWT